jgi:D-threonate/D-erythronate kinase
MYDGYRLKLVHRIRRLGASYPEQNALRCRDVLTTCWRPGAIVGLVADDLTGACDSAVAFTGGGRVEVGVWPHVPGGDLACAAVSTESRDGPSAVAFTRSQFAAERLRGYGAKLMFGKVDSQLRGNVAADVAGVLDGHAGSCLFAPALPQVGRVTQRGHQQWDDNDIDIVALLAGTGRPVRIGSPEEHVSGAITVCDASSDEDLRHVARVTLETSGILPIGTAGLAHFLGRELPMTHDSARAQPSCRRPAAVVGSRSARAQAERAKEYGWPVFWLGETESPPGLDDYDGLVVTGGDTAYRVLSSLGATSIELRGELMPLMPFGTIVGGPRDGLPVALKSGAFGDADAVRVALSRLTNRD